MHFHLLASVLASLLCQLVVAQSTVASTSYATFLSLSASQTITASTPVDIIISPSATASASGTNTLTSSNSNSNAATTSSTSSSYPVFTASLDPGGGQGTGPAPAPGGTQGGQTLGPGDGYTVSAAMRGMGSLGWVGFGTAMGAGLVAGLAWA